MNQPAKTPAHMTDAVPPPDPSTMPAFARAIRGLVRVPKAELDAAIAKEKVGKKRAKRK